MYYPQAGERLVNCHMCDDKFSLALFSKGRKRQKLIKMFYRSLAANSDGFGLRGHSLAGNKTKEWPSTIVDWNRNGGNQATLPGVFICVDAYKRKIHSQKLMVGLNGERIVVGPCNNIRPLYLWFETGRHIRLKAGESNVVSYSKKITFSTKKLRMERGLETNELKIYRNRKGKVGYCKISDDAHHEAPECSNDQMDHDACDSDEEMSSIDEYGEDEPKRGRPYLKTIQRKSVSFALDKSVTGKHSKARKHYLGLPCSRSLSPAHFQEFSEDSEIPSIQENLNNEEETLGPRKFTLGDYCSLQVGIVLGLQAPVKSIDSDYFSNDISTCSKDISDAAAIETKESSSLAPSESFMEMAISPDSEGNGVKRPEDDRITEDCHLENPITKSQNVMNGATETAVADTLIKEEDDIQSEDYAIVKLPRAALRQDNLKTEFRLDYREGACKPRRFVINISRLLYHHITLVNRLRLRTVPKLDLTTYIIFAFHSEFHNGVDAYKVWISSFWSRALNVRDVFQSQGITQIQTLIQATINAIEKVNIKDLMKLAETPNREMCHSNEYLPVCLFFMLNCVQKWIAQSVQIPYTTEWCGNHTLEKGLEETSGAEVLNDILELLNTDKKHTTSVNKRGPNEPSICGGCLTTLNSKSFSMALTTCSHWFCEDCWKSRVHAEFLKDDVPRSPACLERGCSVKIEPVTMLTFLNIEDIRKLNQSRIKAYIESVSWMQLCPNGSCKHILYAKPSKPAQVPLSIPVRCPCLRQCCLGCLKEPHWPTSCLVAESYRKSLDQRECDMLKRSLRNEEYPDVILHGKQCPRCGLFIQRTNGMQSKFYTCGCGCHFCWSCGKEGIGAEFEHQHYDCRDRFDFSDKLLKDSVTKNGPGSTPRSPLTKWFQTALKHRTMRHPHVVSALYAMADNLAARISSEAHAGKYVGDAKKATIGWKNCLRKWARINRENLEVLTSGGRLPLKPRPPSNQDRPSSSRPVSRALSSALSLVSTTSSYTDEFISLDSSISAATSNIVHIMLEIHHLAEHSAVMLDTAVTISGKFVRCLERIEDLSTSLGILLQDPHPRNVCRVIPTFLRLKTQIKQAIADLDFEVDSLLGSLKLHREQAIKQTDTPTDIPDHNMYLNK